MHVLMLCRLIILSMHPVYLSSYEEAAGQTVHLTDPSPHPVEEIYQCNGH